MTSPGADAPKRFYAKHVTVVTNVTMPALRYSRFYGKSRIERRQQHMIAVAVTDNPIGEMIDDLETWPVEACREMLPSTRRLRTYLGAPLSAF
jgi:hypothetical protein